MRDLISYVQKSKTLQFALCCMAGVVADGIANGLGWRQIVSGCIVAGFGALRFVTTKPLAEK
jgi:hypothetical protein